MLKNFTVFEKLGEGMLYTIDDRFIFYCIKSKKIIRWLRICNEESKNRIIERKRERELFK